MKWGEVLWGVIREHSPYLQKWNKILVIIFEFGPLLVKWWHQDIHIHRILQGRSHCVRQGPDGVIEDEHVFVLIFVECKNEVTQDGLQVWCELRPCVFLECCKSAATGFLYALVVIQDHAEKLGRQRYISNISQKHRSALDKRYTYALHSRNKELRFVVFGGTRGAPVGISP
jgi:hypothetical protein